MAYTIRELRKARGFTQQQVADGVGISLSMYNMLERGKRRMNEDHLARFATFYSVKEPELYAEEPGDSEISRIYRRLSPKRKKRLLQNAHEHDALDALERAQNPEALHDEQD